MNKFDEIIQIGNLYPDTNFENQQRGRIYLPVGVSPTLVNTAGGGGRHIKILVEYNNPKP